MTAAVQSNKPPTTRVMSAAKFERLSGSPQTSMSYFRFAGVALRSEHRGVCRRVRR
jgi:hypothetical protein